MKKQWHAAAFVFISATFAVPVHAACHGEGLIDVIRDGVEQAWAGLSGKTLEGEPAPPASIVCPEVMAKPPVAPPPTPVAKAEPPPPPLDLKGDGDGDGVSDGDDWCQTTPAGARVDERGCDLIPEGVVSLPDRQFEPDKDGLNPLLQNELERLAKRITATPGRERLKISGHADSQGKAAYNDDLSLRRAWGVADFLSSKGVPLDSIDYSGEGESMPIADNRRRAGRAKNRRVVITIN